MRLPTSIAALAVAASPLATSAFAPVSPVRLSVSFRASAADECATEVCDVPSGLDDSPSLVGVPNGANPILSAVVTNSEGDFVRIDDAVTDSSAPHVVIYLRHMG